MRLRTLGAGGLAALALSVASCSDGGVTAPSPEPSLPSPRFALSAATELFISEYVEGSSNNKALEIYNGTGAPVDLAALGYEVRFHFNGSASPGTTVELTGTVASGDVYVLAHGSAVQEVLDAADQVNSASWYNGDDAVALVRGETVVDVVGQIGFDPGAEWGSGAASTADNTLRRRADVCAGDPDGSDPFDPAAEWDGFETNAFDGLGRHSPGECGDDPGPPGEIAAVVVSPAEASVSVGGAAAFSAAGFDAEGRPAPGAYAWSSADPGIATIDPVTGEATGVAAGEVEITARAENGVEGRAVLRVLAAPAGGDTRISEIHYDNEGTDVGEAIEVEGPAGTDLAGWQLVLYNGNGGGTYGSAVALSGLVPDQCEGRGALAFEVAPLQNGPDAVALVDASGEVVEFLSYGGSFTATDGPASGRASTDIGVAETGATPAGHSLQRVGGAWLEARPASFGACNEGGDPPPPPAAGIVIHELMGEPASAESASWGEWFEVHNTSAAAINLRGWTIASGGQPEHVVAEDVVVQPGGYAVLGRGDDPSRNGGVTLDYNYFTGSSTLWLDGSDWLALRDGSATVDSVRWSGLPRGVTRAVRDAAEENADVEGANWGYSTTTFGAGDFGTPGAANGALAHAPPATPSTISFSGRLGSDPPLPVGFEDQLFATLRDGSGQTVQTTFTWSSETPSIASIDPDGVIRALAAGTATVRATAEDGTTRTYSLPTAVATASATAEYEGNAEFGEPADGDAGDDFLVRYEQFTVSWNPEKGTPNWASYNLEESHIGEQDRCDCFTFDPDLPGHFPRYTTADYTGAGAHHGYGIDRGHLVRSFDRTTGTLDNARTFYFTNIVPQAADNNQGPWAALESHLGDLARFEDREVYVVAGVHGSLGTVKDEGKIVIPESVWKVAVILPRDHGLDDVDDAGDLEVVAVIMPNVPGIRNVPWTEYEATVDEIEALTGYDLLHLLPDEVERSVESDNTAPAADAGGPYSVVEGTSVTFDGGASSDPDGHALVFSWSFGDGASGTGAAPEHAYRDDGVYTVLLTVSDPYGGSSTDTTTVMVVNASPEVGEVAGATLLPGETYEAGGSFSDPGADDSWTATVDYGDGSGAHPLPLDGKGFALEHRYTAAGTYTVRVTVTDDEGGSGTATATVVVRTPAEAIASLAARAPTLLDAEDAKWVLNKLDVAAKQVAKGNFRPAANQLSQVASRIQAIAAAGGLSPQDAASLLAELERIVRTLQT